MSVYKWSFNIETDTHKGVIYCIATFKDPRLHSMIGAGFTKGEAIKDLKQVRREFIHWHEQDGDILPDYRQVTTNGRSK